MALEPDSLTEYVRHYIDARHRASVASLSPVPFTRMATLDALENRATLPLHPNIARSRPALDNRKSIRKSSITKLQQIHGMTQPGGTIPNRRENRRIQDPHSNDAENLSDWPTRSPTTKATSAPAPVPRLAPSTRSSSFSCLILAAEPAGRRSAESG